MRLTVYMVSHVGYKERVHKSGPNEHRFHPFVDGKLDHSEGNLSHYSRQVATVQPKVRVPICKSVSVPDEVRSGLRVWAKSRCRF